MSKPPFANKKICAGKFALLKKIGDGSFGDVFAAQNIQTHEEVAIKIVFF